MDIKERWREMNRATAETLDDPEYVFTVARKGLGLLVGLSVASVSFGFGIIFLRQGRTGLVFASALLFWSGYLFAHYTTTGKLIHQRGEGGELPRERSRELLALTGILLVLAGITALPFPVVEGDTVMASLAAATAGIGYIMAHLGLTGSLM